MFRLFPSVFTVSGILLAGFLQAAEQPLSLPTQLILGSGNDSRDLQSPLTRHSLTQQDLHIPNQGANLSESLQRVPGLIALNRQNYAQDLQISSRGFGARAQFGVRGVRLVQDGIPLTMPDGQGQPALFDLDGLSRIEVLRGPLTTLYGNASGGIIQGFTGEAPFYPTLDNRSVIGSDGLWRSRLRYGGQHGNLNVSANISRLETDGYRDHSQTRRDIANLRLGWDIDDDSQLTLLINSLDQPDTQDPLGLTAQQLREDRRQARSQATTFDTRKSVRHNQIGLNYQRRLSNADELTVMLYGGERVMQQYLGFPGHSPISPSKPIDYSSGAVVELDRRFGGGELGWQRQTELFSVPVQLAAGVVMDYQGEDRKGFHNNLGNKGVLKRDEFNDVGSREAYLIGTWQLAPRWELVTGVRHTRVQFESDDDFFTDGGIDSSGKRTFHQTNPAVGLNWQWTPELSLYGALGQGFETPTFQEMAYGRDSSGINLGLDPAISRNGELGLKWRRADTRLDLALFESQVKDEIVTAGRMQVNGQEVDRNYYTNAGRSTRRGVELSVQQLFEHGLQGYLAYTYLQAKYDRFVDDDHNNQAGNSLPGIPRHSFFAELAWRPANSGFSTGIEAQGMSKRYATDSNDHQTSGYAIVNWRAGYTYELGNITLEPFARLDNLADRDYVGSLIINEGNQRFYEPAPGRNWLVGLGVQYQWK